MLTISKNINKNYYKIYKYKNVFDLLNDYKFKNATYYNIQGVTFEDVKSKLIYGDKKLIKDINISYNAKTSEFSNYSAEKSSYKNSVVGGAVNVARYCSGLPDCMRQISKKEINKKIINIAFDIGYPWSVKNSQAKKKLIEIFACIHRLELQGYRVNLSACRLCLPGAGKNNFCAFFIPLKKESERLNISRFAYILTQPEFFRSFMFDLAEQKTGVKIEKTISMPSLLAKNGAICLDFINFVFDAVYKDNKINNCIYLNYFSNLNEAFGKYE